MSRVSHLLFFFISHALFLSLAQDGKNTNQCPLLSCGFLGNISFPFFNGTNSECGLLEVNCKEQAPTIQLGKDVPKFYVTSINRDNTLVLKDQPAEFVKPLDNRSCVESLRNFSLPSSLFYSFEPVPKNQSLFKCPGSHYSVPENYSSLCNDSRHSIIYYNGSNRGGPSSTPPQCSIIQSQMNKTQKGVEFFNLYTGWFRLQVLVTEECQKCNQKGGHCIIDTTENFQCTNVRKDGLKLHLGLGIGIGGSTILIVVLCIWFIRRRKKQKYTTPSFHSRYTSSDPSISELEVGSVYFQVPVFSFTELAEATNNFNEENELGDGGFGTVYYAKLRDGREVAVKRLYEHNYRRLEQFMNEVEILTRLHHKNLVSLYGCTSRHSQGLLLVYEFVPNGTVADHLHGDRAKPGSLTWPIRLNIAIETASALAYLHASDIIHRDVKTHNILLDKNFCVKVADFGLSRLFPTNVTHVSTAPQGSPGYVDPEYHQYYQLNDKSDVYSFGVVMIELISSLPAVDITRHKNEIILANLAINRIQNCAIDKLIDPCLGYQSKEEVKRMTTKVAELAFLCLQQNKELRPSMGAVLEELGRIERGESKLEKLKSVQPPAPPPDWDDLALLKHIQVPPSPISVTEKWITSDTTSNFSG